MQKPAWMPCLLLLSAISVTACGAGNSSGLIAPPVLDYSPEVQAHAADELEALGPACPRDAVFGGCSAVKRLVLDYGWLREQVRAIE